MQALHSNVQDRTFCQRYSLKTHSIALILGFIVGMIMIIPHIMIPLQTQNHAVYIPFLRGAITGNTEDEVMNLSRVRRAFEGEFPPTEGHIYENRKNPTPRETLPYAVLGGLTHLVGSMHRMVILCDFLFPIFHILIFYAFLICLTRSRLISAAGSILCFFGNDLILYVPPRSQEEWALLIRNLSDYISATPIYFGDLPDPGFSFLLLLSALFFLYLSMTYSNRVFVWAQGFFSGLLFYTYFFYWPFYFAGTGVLFIFSLLNKQNQLTKKIILGWLVGAVVSIPYWWMVFQARQLPDWHEVGERYGILYMRNPFKFQTLKYLLFLILFTMSARKRIGDTLFFTAFLLGGMICLNLHVLTGWIVEPTHWQSRVLNPLVLMMLTYLLALWYQKWEIAPLRIRFHILQGAIVGLAAMLLIWAVNLHLSFSRDARFSIAKFRQMAPHIEAMKWLDLNSSKGEVVLTINPELVHLVPVYSKLYNFLPSASPTTTPFAEMEDRMMRAYKFLGISLEQIDFWMRESHYLPSRFEYYEKYVRPYSKKLILQEIYKEDSWIFVFWHQRYYFSPEQPMVDRYAHPPDVLEKISKGESYRYVPASERTRMSKLYEAASSDAQDLIRRYKCNYLYIGPYERAVLRKNLESDPNLEKIYSNGTVDLYRFVHGETPVAT